MVYESTLTGTSTLQRLNIYQKSWCQIPENLPACISNIVTMQLHSLWGEKLLFVVRKIRNRNTLYGQDIQLRVARGSQYKDC